MVSYYKTVCFVGSGQTNLQKITDFADFYGNARPRKLEAVRGDGDKNVTNQSPSLLCAHYGLLNCPLDNIIIVCLFVCFDCLMR